MTLVLYLLSRLDPSPFFVDQFDYASHVSAFLITPVFLLPSMIPVQHSELPIMFYLLSSSPLILDHSFSLNRNLLRSTTLFIQLPSGPFTHSICYLLSYTHERRAMKLTLQSHIDKYHSTK